MSETTGTLETALENARDLASQGRRAQALEQLDHILNSVRDMPQALCLKGSLVAEEDRIEEAIDLLERALRAAPDYTLAALELARVQRYRGDLPSALKTLSQLTQREPNNSQAWRLLGDIRAEAGDHDAARAALARAAQTDPHRQAMGQALETLRAGRSEEAETQLKALLDADPQHVYSALALASIALEGGHINQADRYLAHARALLSHFEPIWRLTARLHFMRSDYRRCLAATEKVVETAPDAAASWALMGDVKAWSLNAEAAAHAFQKSLELDPRQAEVWMGLGHALKAAGHRRQAQEAYHKAVDIQPELGEAWWSLADLKTYSFSQEELDRLSAASQRAEISPFNRAGFAHALGVAFEAREAYDAAFDHFAAGNGLKHHAAPFDIETFEAECAAVKGLFANGLPERQPGAAPVTPIFIVGLPRAGSTLVEQILASHSAVDTTAELAHMIDLAGQLRKQLGYPDALGKLTAESFADLGARYLYETEPVRGEASFFTDKTPNNFLHVGLIANALPNAIIIDARRDPRDCALSGWKQNFARGQTFTNDLVTLARYYRAYADMMDHLTTASPGRIHKVQYEAMVADPDQEIRKLLEACGLEFEEACTRFWETKRTINTPSAEQVRQPIYASGVGSWKRYEHRLSGFLEALGDRVEG